MRHAPWFIGVLIVLCLCIGVHIMLVNAAEISPTSDEFKNARQNKFAWYHYDIVCTTSTKGSDYTICTVPIEAWNFSSAIIQLASLTYTNVSGSITGASFELVASGEEYRSSAGVALATPRLVPIRTNEWSHASNVATSMTSWGLYRAELGPGIRSLAVKMHGAPSTVEVTAEVNVSLVRQE